MNKPPAIDKIGGEAVPDSYRQWFDKIYNTLKDGASGSVTVVTDVNFGTNQKKTQTVTITDGIVTSVGSESGWG